MACYLYPCAHLEQVHLTFAWHLTPDVLHVPRQCIHWYEFMGVDMCSSELLKKSRAELQPPQTRLPLQGLQNMFPELEDLFQGLHKIELFWLYKLERWWPQWCYRMIYNIFESACSLFTTLRGLRYNLNKLQVKSPM